VPATRNDGLIARYETLRRQALDGIGMQSQGMALFVRRGVVAWMQAWSQCAVPLASPASAPSPAPNDHELCPTQLLPVQLLPVQLHADVATLLASMVLFVRQEATAC
jgi:hypothetical protein